MKTRELRIAAPRVKQKAPAAEILSTRIGRLVFTHDFVNGYPTPQTIEKLYDERDFQRACQAYLWSLPAVSFAAWRRGQASIGAGDGTIGAFVSVDDKLGILTPNATTPYYMVFADLSAGPLVVDLPPSVRGGMIDAWQCALPESTNAGTYLVLGPGQKAPNDVTDYELRRCATFGLFIGLRITATDPVEAQQLLGRFRVYAYNKRGNPPTPHIVSPRGKKWSGMPPRDISYWQLLHDVMQREPIMERDRFFHAMLKPLGIERAEPFRPNPRQKQLLTDAVLVGEAMARANTFERRFPGVMYRPETQWHFVLLLDADRPEEFWYLLDERAAWFYEAVSANADMAPKEPGPSSAYLGAYKDRAGSWLDGGTNYRLRVPADPPAKLFWSVTLYDVNTRSLIVNERRIADRSSRMELQKNDDGSVDIYCGPDAPRGFERNWIPTDAGRNWFAYFRLYEPTQPYFDRSWPLGDFEIIP